MSALFVREEHETGFTPILKRHLEATPGAIAVAIVDAEGEAVDYAGDTIDPFDIKVAAATFRIILVELETGPHSQRAGLPKRLWVRGATKGYMLDALPDGYALLAILDSDAALGHASRTLDGTLRAIFREAGWAAPPELSHWSPVEVELGPDQRPRAVRAQQGWVRAVVIGRVATGLSTGEVGYRVELPEITRPGSTNHEATLVRGIDEVWYADLPISET